MKAIVHHSYGSPDVLHVDEVDTPTPTATQALVEVRASTVNRSDCGYRAADPFFTRFFTGMRRPKEPIPGTEFSGVVTDVGAEVGRWSVGDEVFGLRAAANAAYLCIDDGSAVAPKPANVTFEQAASVPDGACIALACLRKAELSAGTRIVVYGASGSIGTAAVQLAKHFGAHVTAVCGANAVELVRSLGADVVIDRGLEDFTQNGETYDVIFDAVGKHSYRRCRGSLTPRGIFLETDLGFMWHVPLLMLWTRVASRRRVTLPIPTYTREEVEFVARLLTSGELVPVVDRIYPLAEVIAATTYVETGEKIGNVVLTLEPAALG